MDQAQQLRNVIKQRNQNYIEPARVITITSGKGGVGKSNTSVNLAVWLSRLGKRVIIFDADFGLANVEVMFGVIPKYTLADVIYENQTIKSIISNGPLGIDFISAGSSVVGLNNLNHKQIHFIVSAINELNSMYDFIIIDTGAGVSEQVMEFVAASNEIVLVTTPEPTSITDSYSLLKALYKRPDFDPSKVCIRVISNRAASKEDGSIVFNKINSVVMQFLNGSLEYLGYVPSDAMDWIPRTVRQRQRKIDEAIKNIELRTGKTANDADLAKELSISEDELCSWQSQLKVTNVVSLDEFDESGPEPVMDAAHNSHYAQPEEIVTQEELKTMLVKSLDNLTEKERRVIELYYYEDLTLKEISNILEVSESRVSQLHTKGLIKMRKVMGPYMNILTNA